MSDTPAPSTAPLTSPAPSPATTSDQSSGVALRPAVAALPAYVPGARAAEGERTFKLSSNENPYPPLPAVLDAVATGGLSLNRYPDMGVTDLTEALAARLTERSGVVVGPGAAITPAEIVTGTGSVAVLGHVLAAVCEPGDEVVVPWRSFEAYPIVVSTVGATFVPVPLQTGADDPALAGRLDLPALAAAVTDRTKVVVVCSPNNPTGPSVHADELAELLASVPPHVLVVLDEAYVEFVRDPETPDGLAVYAAHPNVVLLRTFSKAYGLAGLRVGYGVARPDLAAGIRAVSTPFGVSEVAQRAAVVSLAARDELLERVEELTAERARVVGALREQGWQLPDAQGNFVWFAFGAQTLDRAAQARAAGVLVRPFAGDGLRVTIGEPEANDALIALAATWR